MDTQDIDTTGGLQAMVLEETKRRALISDFISKHMSKGVDYGEAYAGSKPTLLKPGAEKILMLFHIQAEFCKDADTWEMLGSPAGTLTMLCKLYDNHGRKVGEGRGACTMAEKQNKANTAIKICEKRAQVDAVLRVFSLSDIYDQDLEESEYAVEARRTQPREMRVASVLPENPNAGAVARVKAKETQPFEPITKMQSAAIHKLMGYKVIPPDFDGVEVEKLTKSQASRFMEVLIQAKNAGGTQ